MPETRYVRVSRRGRWHRVDHIVESTGALATRCGRVLAPTGLQTAATLRDAMKALRCEKCS